MNNVSSITPQIFHFKLCLWSEVQSESSSFHCYVYIAVQSTDFLVEFMGPNQLFLSRYSKLKKHRCRKIKPIKIKKMQYTEIFNTACIVQLVQHLTSCTKILCSVPCLSSYILSHEKCPLSMFQTQSGQLLAKKKISQYWLSHPGTQIG